MRGIKTAAAPGRYKFPASRGSGGAAPQRSPFSLLHVIVIYVDYWGNLQLTSVASSFRIVAFEFYRSKQW